MSDDLYQSAIMERAKTPVRAGRLGSPDISVTVDNPLCGDRVTLDVKLDNGTVADIGHHVRGCALCQASASIMAEAVAGQRVSDVGSGRDKIKAMFGGSEAPAAPWSGYGIFAPVRSHKSRQDCVLLPLEALAQALAQVKT